MTDTETAARAVSVRWWPPAMTAGVGLTVLVTAAVLSPAAVERGPELCVFRRLTGLPCPGCGLTRSWVNFAHGDIGTSVAFNAFGPVLLAATVVAVIVAGWMLVTRRGVPRVFTSRSAIRLAAGALAIWVGYGVLRAVDAGVGWGVFPPVV